MSFKATLKSPLVKYTINYFLQINIYFRYLFDAHRFKQGPETVEIFGSQRHVNTADLQSGLSWSEERELATTQFSSHYLYLVFANGTECLLVILVLSIISSMC